MQAWFNFYAVMGTAAATLMGLLFVGVSMNAAAALSKGPEGSRRLTEQAFENYLAVMMVSLLALFPNVSLPSFGQITLAVTASWTIWVLVRLYQALGQRSVHETRLIAARRHMPTLIGFALLVYSTAKMAVNGAPMQNTLAAANLVLLFSATEKSWGLLDRIANTTPP